MNKLDILMGSRNGLYTLLNKIFERVDMMNVCPLKQEL